MNKPSQDPVSRHQGVQDFLKAVAPSLPAYRYATFSYVGLNQGGETAILHARLDLSLELPSSSTGTEEASNVCAGRHFLAGIDPHIVERCIRIALSSEHLSIADARPLKLLPRPDGSFNGHDAYYDASTLQQRLRKGDRSTDRLYMSGVSRHQLHNHQMNEFTRELQDLGYDSIESLLRTYGFEPRDQTTLEITTTPIATFDQVSRLLERSAAISFRLAATLDPAQFRAFAKNADPQVRRPPRRIDGEDIDWIPNGSWMEGTWAFDIEEAQILDCWLVYGGRPQAELRIADEEALPNPLHLLVSLVDADLQRMKQLITNPKKKEADDFEAAIAWLFHLLGFPAIHVGAVSATQEEPDILASGPDGEVLLVECTTKVPDDNKLTLLISRTQRMRDLQQRAGPGLHGEVRVIPFMVCPLPSGELAGLRAKAERHSITLLCLPDLEEALERIRFTPNPRQWLRRLFDKPLLQVMTGERRLPD